MRKGLVAIDTRPARLAPRPSAASRPAPAQTRYEDLGWDDELLTEKLFVNIGRLYAPVSEILDAERLSREDIMSRGLLVDRRRLFPVAVPPQEGETEEEAAIRESVKTELDSVAQVQNLETFMQRKWYSMARHINTTKYLNCRREPVVVKAHAELPEADVRSPRGADVLDRIQELRHPTWSGDRPTKSELDAINRYNVRKNRVDEYDRRIQELRTMYRQADGRGGKSLIEANRERLEGILSEMRAQPYNAALQEQFACLLQSVASETVTYTPARRPRRAMYSTDDTVTLPGIFRNEYHSLLFEGYTAPPFVLRTARLPDPSTPYYSRSVTRLNSEILNEAIVGLYGTNYLRYFIPNFVYVYATFMAPGLVHGERLTTEGSDVLEERVFAPTGEEVASRAIEAPEVFSHPDWTHYNLVETITSAGDATVAPTLRNWLQARVTSEYANRMSADPALARQFEEELYVILAQVFLSLATARYVLGTFSHGNLSLDSILIQRLPEKRSIVYRVREEATNLTVGGGLFAGWGQPGNDSYTVETDIIARITDFRFSHIEVEVDDPVQKTDVVTPQETRTERRLFFLTQAKEVKPEGSQERSFTNLEAYERSRIADIADPIERNARIVAENRFFALRDGSEVRFRTGGFDALNGRVVSTPFLLGDVTRLLFELRNFGDLVVERHASLWLRAVLDARSRASLTAGDFTAVPRGIDIDITQFFERGVEEFRSYGQQVVRSSTGFFGRLIHRNLFTSVRAGDARREGFNYTPLDCYYSDCSTDERLAPVTKSTSELHAERKPTVPDYNQLDPYYFSRELMSDDMSNLMRPRLDMLIETLGRKVNDLQSGMSRYQTLRRRATDRIERGASRAAEQRRRARIVAQMRPIYAQGVKDAEWLEATFASLLRTEAREGIVTPGYLTEIETLRRISAPGIWFFTSDESDPANTARQVTDILNAWV